MAFGGMSFDVSHATMRAAVTGNKVGGLLECRVVLFERAPAGDGRKIFESLGKRVIACGQNRLRKNKT